MRLSIASPSVRGFLAIVLGSQVAYTGTQALDILGNGGIVDGGTLAPAVDQRVPGHRRREPLGRGAHGPERAAAGNDDQVPTGSTGIKRVALIGVRISATRGTAS